MEFKEVAEAYQVLKNEQLRAEFDELRQYGSQSRHDFQNFLIPFLVGKGNRIIRRVLIKLSAVLEGRISRLSCPYFWKKR